MRVFVMACLAAGVIAVGVAAILDDLVQNRVSVAIAEPSARINPDSAPTSY
jgi:hypothetical protein